MDVIVEHENDKIYPLVFTPETIEVFWNKAKQFPMLYGHEIQGDINKFIDLFFIRDTNGMLQTQGLFWVMNPEEFTGVFYLNNIFSINEQPVDAHVHYTFFDRRHHGRVPIIRKMLKYVFEHYGFRRLTAEIGNFNSPQARHFASECGFKLEGKRRNAVPYKDDWFDVNLYGLLKSEIR